MDIEHEDGKGAFVDQFFNIICQFKPLLRVLLSVEILLILLGIIAFPFSNPESGGRIILYVVFAMNAPILVSVIGLIYLCRSRG